MTWLAMANVLFEKSKALSPTGAHVHLDTAAWLQTWTAHQNQMADAAARIFAARMEWPDVQGDIKCQLYFRSLFAIERCFEHSIREKQSSNCPKIAQARLEKLLIEAWGLDGLEWAKRKYELKRPPYDLGGRLRYPVRRPLQ
jgi:hypothetical protein